MEDKVDVLDVVPSFNRGVCQPKAEHGCEWEQELHFFFLGICLLVVVFWVHSDSSYNKLILCH